MLGGLRDPGEKTRLRKKNRAPQEKPGEKNRSAGTERGEKKCRGEGCAATIELAEELFWACHPCQIFGASKWP